MNDKYLNAFLSFYNNIKNDLIDSQNTINEKIYCDIDNNLVKDCVKELADSNQDGKYIRGTLIALGNYLFGSKEDYKSLAYAYELFETAILVHDDIIDEAEERRHNKTIPYRLKDKYNIPESLKFGTDIAICDGIYGYYLANNIILDNYKNNKYLSDILHLYNDIVLKTVEGEILDTALTFVSKNNIKQGSKDDVFEIYSKKTAWYTIIGPFLLGMMLNGQKASKELIDALMEAGIAFQIKDDILGVFAENIGKSLTDIQEYKQTILYTHILTTEYKDEFLKYYGTLGNDEKIKDLFIKSGSKEYALSLLDASYNNFICMIDRIDELSLEVKNILKGLMIFIIKRDK